MCGALAKISAEYTYDLRYKTLSALLYYDQHFYDKPESSPSAVSSNLANDCEKVSGLGGPVLGLQVMILTNMVGGLIIGFIVDAILALTIFAFVPLMLLGAGKGEMVTYTGISNNDIKKTSEIASDTLANIKTVQSFNRETFFYDKYIEATRAEGQRLMPSIYVNSFLFGFRFFTLFLLYGVVCWYGAYRVKEGDLSAGDMLITFYCVLFNYLGFIVMGTLTPDVEGGIQGGKNLFRIIDYKPDINGNSSEGSMDTIDGKIEFCEVKFKYEGRDVLVLNGLSFFVEAGSTLGITGTTGSGKSTISQLLLRFYDPISGDIYVDTKPLNSFNIRHLRNSICWVGQEPMLFLGSIFYNMQIASAGDH